jgi:hypothetical protein
MGIDDVADFSELYNPYDFANPVSDRKLFQGRDEELREIDYYMKQAKAAPRPINLALIGERAAGKTSFLNMIAATATGLDFCVATIDLNESDAESPLRLFFKIFDELLTAACDRGAFGGLTGRTYQTYRDIVDTRSVPVDTTFCPFAFPLQYAAAQLRDNSVVSEALIKRDLRAIAEELGTTSVLLFDECDVLSSSHVEIEQLRNVFMNSAGYMLVFAGTPHLFPVLDKVFSPIVRQFKKVHVGAYADIRGTMRCMEAPLGAIGLNLKDLVGTSLWYVIHQVHEVSGGRPYEIQLLCHFMFKRMQMAQGSSGLDLTYDALEDVRRELESAHDVEARPVLAAIKRLDDRELNALGTLTQACEHATLRQVASIERIRGRNGLNEAALSHELACLVSAGILYVDAQNIICYNGDEFDRIYANYFAESRDVHLSIRSQSLRTVMFHALMSLLSDGPVEVDRQLFVSPGYTGDLGEVASRLASGDAAGLLSLPVHTAVELAMSVLGGLASGGISSIVWACPWGEARTWFFGDPEVVRGSTEAMHRRASLEGSSVVLSTNALLEVQRDVVLAALASLPPRGLKAYLLESLSARAAEMHLSDSGTKPDIDWLECALYLHHVDDARPQVSNDLGYMLLARNRKADAVPLLEAAAVDGDRGSDSLLSLVNLCVAQLSVQQLDECEGTWRRIEAHIGEFPDHLQASAMCVMVPDLISNSLVTMERRGVTLMVGVEALRGVLPHVLRATFE